MTLLRHEKLLVTIEAQKIFVQCSLKHAARMPHKDSVTIINYTETRSLTVFSCSSLIYNVL